MKKQISYNEPYFDPFSLQYDQNKMSTFSIVVRNEDEYNATMAAISDPTREIPQDSIVVTDLPPDIDPIDQLRADLDYIALMDGVDLSV